jgi:uncharacterized membrane protein YdjX (TVP38/TMEM64 family)
VIPFLASFFNNIGQSNRKAGTQVNPGMHLRIFLIISTIGRIPGTLMATVQGAKAFDQEYITLLFLLGISALIILVFYVYHETIHGWIRRYAGGDQKKRSKF